MPDASPPSRAGRKPRARISVERAAPQHVEALQLFFRNEWGGDGGEIDLSIPQWVCIRNDEAIGYLGTIPAVFQLGGDTLDATWLKGFWVTEKYRSGPVGPMLLEKAMSELGVVGSQVVAPAARRVMESQGFTHRCTLFNRVLLLRAGRVAGRINLDNVGSFPAPLRVGVSALQKVGVMTLAGGIAGLGLRAVGALGSAGSGAFSVKEGWDVEPTALDGLWSRLRDQVHTTPDRSAEALFDRYRGDSHALLTVWSGDSLSGWAVVRRPGEETDPRLSGLRVASIADVYYPLADGRAGMAALAAAERAARDMGADALLCSGSHPSLERTLSRRGYVTFPGNVLIMARDTETHPFATGGENMWVTRGDARSDETF